jgi:hypothetical protein
MDRIFVGALAILSGIALNGCCGTCLSYKAAVAKYTSSLPERGKVYYGAVLPELKKELVLNDAALVCLVDKDQGLVNSPACLCTEGLPDAWEKNCATWLK